MSLKILERFSKFKKFNERKDKMYRNMIKDNDRYKILCGELNGEDCNAENVHGFLCSLKIKTATQEENGNEVIEEEFTTVVKKSKRRSTSSMFSKRDYSVHNCATCCEQMVKVLARFYDVLI